MNPMQTPQPLYAPGDPIAWHATQSHGAGTGIVTAVLTTDGATQYQVHQLIDGKATNRVRVVAEAIAFPTRSLSDTRPQPAVHRSHQRDSG